MGKEDKKDKKEDKKDKKEDKKDKKEDKKEKKDDKKEKKEEKKDDKKDKKDDKKEKKDDKKEKKEDKKDAKDKKEEKDKKVKTEGKEEEGGEEPEAAGAAEAAQPAAEAVVVTEMPHAAEDEHDVPPEFRSAPSLSEGERELRRKLKEAYRRGWRDASRKVRIPNIDAPVEPKEDWAPVEWPRWNALLLNSGPPRARPSPPIAASAPGAAPLLRGTALPPEQRCGALYGAAGAQWAPSTAPTPPPAWRPSPAPRGDPDADLLEHLQRPPDTRPVGQWAVAGAPTRHYNPDSRAMSPDRGLRIGAL